MAQLRNRPLCCVGIALPGEYFSHPTFWPYPAAHLLCGRVHVWAVHRFVLRSEKIPSGSIAAAGLDGFDSRNEQSGTEEGYPNVR